MKERWRISEKMGLNRVSRQYLEQSARESQYMTSNRYYYNTVTSSRFSQCYRLIHMYVWWWYEEDQVHSWIFELNYTPPVNVVIVCDPFLFLLFCLHSYLQVQVPSSSSLWRYNTWLTQLFTSRTHITILTPVNRSPALAVI
jgi:hypothetical protein